MVRICSAGDQLPEHVSRSLHTWSVGHLTLQNIEANAAQPVDVGVIDLGQEADLGGCHRVVVWQEKLEFENAAYVLSVTERPRRMHSVLPSYGDCDGPSIVTSKYLKLSS
jgi:hypothetical protein